MQILIQPAPDAFHPVQVYGVAGNGPGPIVGLSIDPTTSSRYGLQTIGITRPSYVDTQEIEYAQPVTIEFPVTRYHGEFFLERYGSDTFLSKALLKNAKALDVQRRGDRCTGLCILQNNGHRETLGQWDPSETESVQRIYDADADGAGLESLTFVYDTVPDSLTKYVRGIYPGREPGLGSDTFTWKRMDLVWELPPRS
jgi:hypothetical protein